MIAFFLFIFFVESISSQFCEVIGKIKGTSQPPDFLLELRHCFPSSYDDCRQSSDFSVEFNSHLNVSSYHTIITAGTVDIYHYAEYSFHNGLLNARISCTFKAKVTVNLEAVLKDTQLLGDISMEISNLPIAAVDYYSPPWKGYIKSLPNQELFLYDSNIFDGHTPRFLYHAIPLPQIDHSIFNYTIKTSADVNIRSGPMDSLPSHGRNTVRGLFLPSSVLSSPSIVASDKTLFYLSYYSCNETECPQSMISLAQELISSNYNCDSVETIQFDSSLTFDMSLTNDSIEIQALRASTNALFECDGTNNGFISLQLTANTPSPTSWPTLDFFSDSSAAAGMTKASTLNRNGVISGYLIDNNGNVSTIIAQDLFSDSRGGLLVPDLTVDLSSTSYIQDKFYGIGKTATTGVPAIDNFILHQFDDVTQILEEYLNTTMNCTERGFIQYYYSYHKSWMSVHFAEDGDSVTITIFFPISTPIYANDPIIATANQLLASFSTLAAHRLNGTSFQFPVIGQQTNMVANITSLVAASVQIEGLGAFSNYTLKSLQFTANADISAYFPPNFLFTEVDVSWEINTNFYYLRGRTPGVLGAVVAQMGNDGIVYISQILHNPSVAGSIFPSLQNFLGNFSSLNGPLFPTTIDVSTIGEKANWVSLGEYLSTFLTGLSETPSYVIEELLQSALQELPDQYSYIRAQINAAMPNEAIFLHIQLRSLQIFTISTENAVWATKLDTSRLSAPIVISTDVIFTVNTMANGISFQQYASTGSSKISEFSIPLVKGMQIGSVTSGEVLVQVDEANQVGNSFFTLTATAVTDDPNTIFQANLVDSNLLQHFGSASFQIEPDCYRLSPEVITNNYIVGGFFRMLQMAFQNPLNILIPPLQNNLSSMTNVASGLAKMQPWLYVPTSNTAVASTPIFCTPFSSLVVFSLQWNSMPSVQCSIEMNPSNYDDALQQTNEGLQSCGLESIIVAQKGIIDQSNPKCGTIKFFQATPGLISKLTFNSSGGVGSTSSRWISPQAPTFNNWNDMVIYLAALFQQNLNVKPRKVVVSVEEAPYLVNSSFQNFYPSNFSAISFDLAIELPSQVVTPHSSYLSTLNSSIEFILPEGNFIGTASPYLTTEIIVVLDTPPYGGGRISIQTNFSVSGGPETLVTAGSQFTLYIEAQNRTFNSVTKVNGTFFVTLTEGLTILEAFEKDIFETTNGTIFQSLVQVVYVPQKNLTSFYNSSDQMMISLLPFFDSSWMLIPIQLSIQNSSLNYFTNKTFVLPRFDVLGGNTSLGIDINLNLNTSIINGTVGIVNMTSNIGNGSFSVLLASSTSGYQDYNQLFISSHNSTYFFDIWNTTLSINNQILAADMELGVDHNAISDSLSTALFISTEENVSSFQELSQVLRELEWKPSFQSGQHVLGPLQQTGTTTLCSWFQTILLDISNLISDSEYGKIPIPFIKSNVLSLWQPSVGKQLANIESKLCALNYSQLDLNDFCSIVNGEFGTQACTSSNVSDTVLTVELNFQVKSSYATAFLLNTSGIYSNKSLPQGKGINGDLSIQNNVHATIVMVVDLSDGSSYLAPGTGFVMTFELKTEENLQVNFGSLSLTLGNVNLTIGDPVTLTIVIIDDDGNVDFSINGTALFYADVEIFGTVICEIEVNCTSLYDYLSGDYSTISHSERNCNGMGFAEALGILLAESLLENYFSQDFLFATQFIDSVQDLLDGNVFDGVLAALEIPLVRKEVLSILQKELKGFLGPQVMNQFSSLLSYNVLQLALHYKGKDIDQLVLKAFVTTFCSVFKDYLLNCPPVPDLSKSGFNMTINFGRISKNPIINMGFDLGSNGIVSLDLSCPEYFVTEWSMSLVWEYTNTFGTRAYPASHPFLKAEISLTFSENCELSGNFGFIAFSLQPTGSLMGEIIVDYSDGSFIADAQVQANVTGDAAFGVAGEFKKALNGSQSPQAIVYVECQISLAWYWDLNNNTDLTPSVQFDGITVCIGYSLAKTLQRFLANEIDTHIFKTLDKFIGRNGLLLQPLPVVSFLFGPNFNSLELAEFIMNFCDDCQFDGVWEAIQVYEDLQQAMQWLDMITNTIGDGVCGPFVQVLEPISVDFKSPNPQPVPYNAPKSSLNLNGVQDGGIYNDLYTVIEEGSFSITFPFLDNPAVTLISLICKKDIDLVALNFPTFLILVIPPPLVIEIWDFPEVDLVMGFEIAVQLQVPPIKITSGAISKAIFTFSPQKLFGALQIQTQNGGKEIWPISGYAVAYAGVSVDIGPFDGGAYAYIELQASLGLPNVNGQNYVTFEQLYWCIRENGLVPCLSWTLQLSWGFNIYIEICIDYFFGEACWTIVSWGDQFPIATDNHVVRLIQPAAYSNGVIVTSSITSQASPKQTMGQINIYQINPGLYEVDKLPVVIDPYSTQTSTYSNEIPVTTLYTTGAEPQLYVIYATSSPFYFPGEPSQLQLIMSSWHQNFNINEFTLTPSSVSAASIPPIIVYSCATMTLSSPSFGNTISISGNSCPTVIDVIETSSISLFGDPSLYSGKPIQLQGELGLLNIQTTASSYDIDENQIVGNYGELFIQLPQNTYTLTVASHPTENSTFRIGSVAANQNATFIGGNGRDIFFVSLSDCLGAVFLVGNRNINEFTLYIDETPGNVVTVTRNSVIQMGQNSTRRIIISNIQTQIYNVQNNGLEVFEFYLTGVDEDTFVFVNLEGSQESTTVVYVPNCGADGYIRINSVEYSGQLEVVIGKLGKLNSVLCLIEVLSTAGTGTTIYLTADNDTSNYEWDFASNQLRVTPPTINQGILTLDFLGVDRVVAWLGLGSNTVNVKTPSTPTEFVLAFLMQTSEANVVNIVASATAILINGTVESINVISSTFPMQYIGGPLIFVGDNPVYLNGETYKYGQHYVFATSTGNPTNTEGKVPPFTPTSPWMQQIMLENGFTEEESTTQSLIHYKGNLTFFISTGQGGDSVFGNETAANFNISFGDGDDAFWLNNSAPLQFLNVDMGKGSDEVITGASISLAVIDLGSDHDGDLIVFYSEYYFTNIDNNIIVPTGPSDNDYIRVENLFIEDTLLIRDGSPAYYDNSTSCFEESTFVNLNKL